MFERRALATAFFLTSLIVAAPIFSQSGAGGGAGSGGGGSAGGGGTGGGGGPAQQPEAPIPDGGPSPAPEQTVDEPSVGPLSDYFKWKRELAEKTGTTPRLAVDLTSQSAVSGPDEFTAWVWRYDFGIQQKLWRGATVDLDVRGGDGPDAGARLGSTMNTNQYAGTGSDAFVLHLWIEQKLWDDQLTLRAGKMDIGDWIDVNRFGYYNFLGFSQNHNPSIPFPGNPLAAMVTLEPNNSAVYFQAGVANGSQSSYEIGTAQLSNGTTSLFAISELGLKLKLGGQPGVYRFIGWYDGRDLADVNGATVDNDRYGFAVSFDQNLTKDFGLFARYGWGDQSEFNPQQYWQAGFDWKGPIPGRAKDDVALAVAQNRFAAGRGDVVANASSSETYVEAYYNYVVYDWFQIQPVLQVLVDPGATDTDAAWIAGVHLAFRF